MQEENRLHIGKIICKQLKKEGRTKKWLAEKVCCDYSNFCKVLKNQFLDTELLWRISFVLQHDFFIDISKYYTENKNENGKYTP